MLRKEGQITKEQLDEAVALSKKAGTTLVRALTALDVIEPENIVSFASRQLNLPVISISELMINPETISLVQYDLAKQHMVFPVRVAAKVLTLAMADPTNTDAIEEVHNATQLSIKSVITTEKDIVEAYKKYYKISPEEYQSFFKKIGEESEETGVEIKEIDDIGSLVSEAAEDVEAGDEEEIKDELSADAAPIIKLVNGILTKAIKLKVSDIHIEPYEKSFRVRYRLDGALYVSLNLPLQIKNALVSRLKILASLNIAERRVPQDGRIKLRLGKKQAVDFRVSCLPTLFGESMVLRILDKSNLNVDLGKLGFSPENFAKFNKAIKNPFGLVLVTGPTGSGKTTTLYSAVNALNNVDNKILTAEDPVEFNFAGINQVLVRNEVGMTFAAALKAFLRQDPEIILVGEIRDAETAEIAIKAAMTGHLVFSTLHTNDCPSTVGRIIDIGIPGYMVSSALTMILSQRLMRRICAECKEADPAWDVERDRKKLIEMGFFEDDLKDLKIMKGKGCPACQGKGYKGRVAAYELMEVNESIKQAITAQLPEDQLRKVAMKEGMRTLRQDALSKVRAGITTLDEALKHTVHVKEALPQYLLTPDELTFENGDMIIKEGNTDTTFYQLIQGSLVIKKAGAVVAEISQPGEYFGEMSALMNKPRNATIISKGKSRVKAFPGDKLRETLENYPEIAYKVITSCLFRLNSADRKLAEMAKKLAALQVKPVAGA
ncbi:MAG: type IV-A pilus assembly ATPase PilB [Nitrospinae bacterium]|nr:type IV-A pilus assembly ATPase PilB [Nitrospinota bacterium]